MQTISNHMGLDLESREDVPEHTSPNAEPDFAHPNGNEVLHCAGAKRHHTPAVQVVYSKQLDLPYLQECAVILAIDHCTNCQGMVKQRSISEHPDCAMQLSSLVMLGHTIHHPVISTTKMQSRNALLSFLQWWWKDEHTSLFDQR